MKHILHIKLLLLILTLSAYDLALCQNFKDEHLKIASEMKASIINELLKPWYPKSVDSLYGGFLSSFSYDFKPVGNQDKMIVTQARHTWTNSKAAEIFPEVAYFKSSAEQGFKFLKDVMWDKQYGGFYTYTDRKGNVKPGGFAPKEAYGNSFAIYALAAYYQLTGDTDVLNLAKKEFMWMENHSHDHIFKGYYQHMQRDGTSLIRDINISASSERGYKDQNTSIHLLESFTELYNVWPDSLLKERLKEMFFLVRDTIVTKKGYLTLFFTPDWTPVSFKDSSKEIILKRKGLDHVSFGHDVETAYLLLEAGHALGFENDTATLAIAKKMVDHALANGWDDKLGGFYDEGYYFKDKPGITILADTKNWWAQAEGLNSLLLMSDYFPNDKKNYYQKFKTLWSYVQTYLIDHDHGDWYQGGLDKEPQQKLALKGQIWKGTYHNFRALINCVQRLDPDTVPPSVPENLKLSSKKEKAVISWAAAKDDKILLGYNIFSDGIRIGYTPLTNFVLPGLIQKHGSRFAIKSIDVQGNQSGFSKAVYY